MEFNDVRLQYEQLKHEIDSAIAETLSAGRYILGPSVQAFEKEFSSYCHAAFGIGVASGMDALKIGLSAIGVQPGDEVLVPAVSAAATAMAVAQIQATPVFVDIRRDDFTMDVDDALSKRTSRTKATVPVSLYGMPAHLDLLSKLGIPLLEDAAQSHGSDASWGRSGSFSTAAFSFYPTKNLGTYGDGGMIVTSDERVAESARILRNYGQRENYVSEVCGENSRLDELHAAILRVKLKKLDKWNKRRREIAARYRAGLAEVPIGMQAETAQSNCHLFVVKTQYRDDLRHHLSERNVPTLVHYPIALTQQTAFAAFGPGDCPQAEELCREVLSLPIHASLADSDVDDVISAIREFFARS